MKYLMGPLAAAFLLVGCAAAQPVTTLPPTAPPAAGTPAPGPATTVTIATKKGLATAHNVFNHFGAAYLKVNARTPVPADIKARVKDVSQQVADLLLRADDAVANLDGAAADRYVADASRLINTLKALVPAAK